MAVHHYSPAVEGSSAAVADRQVVLVVVAQAAEQVWPAVPVSAQSDKVANG